jgi:tetratricopeptide (TPR) repeat protein
MGKFLRGKVMAKSGYKPGVTEQGQKAVKMQKIGYLGYLALMVLMSECTWDGRAIAQYQPFPNSQPFPPDNPAQPFPLDNPAQPFPPVQSDQPVQPTPSAQPSPSLPPNPPTPKQQPNEFPPNPLELKLSDPLLPPGVDKRPLTAAERKKLIPALDQLNAQAAAQSKAGDRIGAYVTWNRELRLRRFLGPVEEVTALGRVGDVAWKDNETPQVRWITQRLDKIWEQGKAPTPGLGNNINLGAANVVSRTNLLEALGLAYQQVRLPQTAIAVYQQIIKEARQRKDSKKIDATLNTLGQLHLSWFDYPNAATTYKELLGRARAQRDAMNEGVYLTQLVYTYEQAKQPTEAITYQQQLVNFYLAQKNPNPIPALKIKIADNYQLLSRPDLAERNYQSAYQLAQPLLELGYAGDALKKLGVLYLANQRLDAALRVYNYLVGVEQQAYNVYGMMDAYDQIGKIYLSRKAYPQALNAFQRGLVLARQLKYREDYFTGQIKQISK